MNLKSKKSLMTLAKIFGALFIVALLFIGIEYFLGDFSIKLLYEGLSRMSILNIFIIIIMGLVAFAPMILYDVLIKKKLNLDISMWKVIRYGWLINAITIIAGLGDTAGISLRSYFYKNKNLDKKILLKEVSKVSLLTPSGLSLLCVAYLIFYGKDFGSIGISSIATIVFSLYIPAIIAYGLYKKKKTNDNMELTHVSLLVAVSFLDWILSTLLFFLILRLLGTNVLFSAFFPIYTISMVLGMMSMLPGAVGSFDLAMILGLSGIGVSKEFALISIILYRVSYYIIPLIIGAIIFLVNGWSTLNAKFNTLPTIILGKISFFTLRFLIFISGASLLLSTAFPQVFYKIKELYILSSATELHYSKSLVVLVGFLLILMSQLLKYKTKSVYALTILFLVVASILTVTKSFNIIATSYLIIVAIIVALSKNEFCRKGFVVSLEDIIVSVFSLSSFWVLYLVVGYINLPIKNVTRHYAFVLLIRNYKSLVNMGTVAFLASLVFLLCMYLFGKYTNKIPVMTVDECADDINEFLKHHNGTSLTHLIHLKDKYVFFSKDKKGMIQYSIYSNKLIILGNPLGKRSSLTPLISEFHDFASLYGYVPIFFEVSSSMLDLLHDYGYEFMKLGEAAIVNLNEFTLAGQKIQKVRTCCNKITKAGYTFEVVEGHNIDDTLMIDIRQISDIWLAGKKEMGFSMGFFDEEYIKKAPVGLVRDEEGNLKAFVTTMPTYGENKTFCSDLMRYSRETPRGVMDYMFANLLLWGKENGYKYFNFGVSPLANVGYSKYSFLSERFASQIYYHGKIFYSFEGLKKFKGKYAHDWEPKMLAYKNRFTLPVTMLQTNLIVSNPKQKTKHDSDKK